MPRNILRNGDFEADWSEEESHRCLVFPTDGEPYETVRGNIFTPPGWVTWFRHGLPVEHDPTNQDGWAQPEVRDARSRDPDRMHSGEKGMLLFTFYRIHDGGFLQQVQVEPGTRLRLTAWAHAWSNWHGGPHPDDPRWSEGPGHEPGFILEGETTDDNWRNFTFWVGIDPTGGRDPYADTVVWGQGAHIYNAYHRVPPVEAVAEGNTVTVFLRSRTLWPFKHNDAYWDDVVLEIVGHEVQAALSFEPEEPQAERPVQVLATSTQAPTDVGLEVTGPDGERVPVEEAPVELSPEGGAWRWTFVPGAAGTYHVALVVEGRPAAEADLNVRPGPAQTWGLPREQYSRTYVLLPPGAGREWVEAILDSGAWERHRWTIGGSADDAGIGALEDKRVIAVNPEAWEEDLEAFFRQHYPRTRYVALKATSPVELRRKLEEIA